MGGKRGLLFALEFNTNKDIPIRYGLDVTDPDYYLGKHPLLDLKYNLNNQLIFVVH